jgi:FtsZ-binding cell division protein ZapB
MGVTMTELIEEMRRLNQAHREWREQMRRIIQEGERLRRENKPWQTKK